MRKSMMKFGSAALALMMFGTSFSIAEAGPIRIEQPVAARSDVTVVRDSRVPGQDGFMEWRHNRRGGWRDGDGWRGRNWRDRDRGFYYNGHRGYRDYRPGYRRHNGYWFPGAAFATGIIIGGAIANQPRVTGLSRSHVEYCMQRYRSYRVSDDTYQPTTGPRRRCR